MAENAAMTANTAQPDRIDGRDRGHRDGQAAGRTTGDLSTGVLTFLFTDIEGSTARWESQRAAMAAALARHDALLRAAIEGRGGQVFKTVGDAFCAVFADAAAALGAATDAQRALAAENWTAFGPDFDDLRGADAGRRGPGVDAVGAARWLGAGRIRDRRGDGEVP